MAICRKRLKPVLAQQQLPASPCRECSKNAGDRAQSEKTCAINPSRDYRMKHRSWLRTTCFLSCPFPWDHWRVLTPQRRNIRHTSYIAPNSHAPVQHDATLILPNLPNLETTTCFCRWHFFYKTQTASNSTNASRISSNCQTCLSVLLRSRTMRWSGTLRGEAISIAGCGVTNDAVDGAGKEEDTK